MSRNGSASQVVLGGICVQVYGDARSWSLAMPANDGDRNA